MWIKNRNFDQKSEFWSKIEILINKNVNFGRKYIIYFELESKIGFFVLQLKFLDQNRDLWSKIQILVKIQFLVKIQILFKIPFFVEKRNFGQKSKIYI